MENNFQNPLFVGADPCVLLHEGTYYLYCTTENGKKFVDSSSFSTDQADGTDGIFVYRSDDLTHWERAGLCLDSRDVQGEKWFWSPDVSCHNGKFYMVYTAEEHIALAVSDSPLGPFRQEEKRWLVEENAIDGHLFEDEDGAVYLYYVGIAHGNRIFAARMAADLLHVETEHPECVIQAELDWETRDDRVAEAPYMLKHNGRYYLTYSANHTRCPDYCVGCAVSDSPFGPFQKGDGPILHRSEALWGVAGQGFFTAKDGKTLVCAYHCHNQAPDNFKPRKICLNLAEFVPTASGIDALVVHGPKGA